MTTVTCWSHRCRTNTLFAAILVLGAYALVFDKHDDVTGENHLFTFYRAMLRERPIATVPRQVVRPSVTLRYRGHVCCNT